MGGEDILLKTVQEDLPAGQQAPAICTVAEALYLHNVIAAATRTGLQRHP